MAALLYPDAAILIFAKSPVPGQVKSRLWPVLGPAGALALHQALIEQVIDQVERSSLAACEIWISSPEGRAFFNGLCASEAVHVQQGRDLGERMAHAAADALQRFGTVILVGADCPSVDATYLEEALSALAAGTEIVFGPAEDGGYVLLGLKRVPEALFAGVPWGTSSVLAATRQNLAGAGETWLELSPRWDVDRAEDLPRLYALMPDLQARLEHFKPGLHAAAESRSD